MNRTETDPHPDSGRFLVALNRRYRDRPMYAGTVPPAVVADRRRKNKRAAAARRAQRHGR